MKKVVKQKNTGIQDVCDDSIIGIQLDSSRCFVVPMKHQDPRSCRVLVGSSGDCECSAAVDGNYYTITPEPATEPEPVTKRGIVTAALKQKDVCEVFVFGNSEALFHWIASGEARYCKQVFMLEDEIDVNQIEDNMIIGVYADTSKRKSFVIRTLRDSNSCMTIWLHDGFRNGNNYFELCGSKKEICEKIVKMKYLSAYVFEDEKELLKWLSF